jgi:hypothetical protein
LHKKYGTIDALVRASVCWAGSHDRGCFYGKSDDQGEINLGIERNKYFEGQCYLAIVISSVIIPLKRRKQGLYRALLQSLDDLGKYGLRCHSVTENEWLADRHRKHGYIEEVSGESSSFYFLIGSPLPESTQAALSKQRLEAWDRLAAALSSRQIKSGGSVKRRVRNTSGSDSDPNG